MIKQIYSVIAISGGLLLMLSIFNSCIQEETFVKATVETNQVTSVTEATATCGGMISTDGGSDVTSRGVCWSTSPNPTIDNDTTIDNAGTGQFSSSINGLTPSTTYFVRAYAVNKGGTGYGLQMSFTTKTISITTTPISVSLLTATSAIGGGNVITDGDSSLLSVKVRGVCWNTFPSPTIDNSKTSDGSGGGSFTSNIVSLTAFTTYYVRAYATNGNSTFYGNDVSFTTLSGAMLLTTNNVSLVTAFAATCGGAITSDGGAPVIARGVCWSTTQNPTITDGKTTDGTGLGSYTSRIIGLFANTLYYVRAYSINSVGTAYGNERSFTSQNSVTDIGGNAYSTIKIGTQEWMAENLKTTKYRNGETIGTTTPATKDISSESTPKYQWAYNGDEGNASKYGRLYTWYTVSDSRNIAPTGWHVPTDTEWTTLENYLIANGYNYDGTTTGSKIAKSLAATTNWPLTTGIGAIGNDLSKNNTSGFACIPGGYRLSDGTFSLIGYSGYWWSSTQSSTGSAWTRGLFCNNSNVLRDSILKQHDGFSVRCVRD